MEEERIRVCAYCRVSTKKSEQLQSFTAQMKYFSNMFKNTEYSFDPKADLFADKGISGTALNRRDNFLKMLYECGLDVVNVQNESRTKIKITTIESNRKSKYKYIYVSNSSRFGRNLSQVIDIIRDLIKKGTYVKFIDRNMSSESEKDMEILPEFFRFDELESVDKSKKVKEGYKKSVLVSNKIHCNSKLYGYIYNVEKNKLTINPAESEVVKKIFTMYAQGQGIWRIVKDLMVNNIKTRMGKNFSKSTISRMLDNPKYAGINQRLRYDAGVVFNKHNPRKSEKPILIEEKSGHIEKIIEPELFYKCVELRKSKINTQKNIGKYTGTSKYAGLLRCGCCGSKYYSNMDRGRRYYNCSLKKFSKSKECDNINVSEQFLDEEIKKLIKSGDMQKDYYANKMLSIEMCKNKIKNLKKLVQTDKFPLVDAENKKLKEFIEELEKILTQLRHSKSEEETKILEKAEANINKEINITKNRIESLSRDNNTLMEQIKKTEDEIVELKSMEFKGKYNNIGEILEEINYIIINNVNNKPELIIVYNFESAGKWNKFPLGKVL